MLPGGRVGSGAAGEKLLSAGYQHTCAIKPDGTLACWGNNYSGQLNNTPTGSFTAPSASFAHTCGLKTDGTLACWGNNSSGQLTNIPTGTFTTLSAGDRHTCALRTNGILVCWGSNDEGQTSAPTGTLPTSLNFLTDTLSGTPTVTGSFPLTGQAVDANGFAASQAYTLLVNLDTTAPVITPVVGGIPGSNGWYTSNVNVSWTLVDNESSITSQLNCNATTINADTSGTTLTCQATSSGGTASQSITIKRDTAPPTLAPAVTPNPVSLNSSASATVNASDVMSGIAAASCGTLDTSTVGDRSVSCTATDANGQPVTNLGSVALTVEPMACPGGSGQRVKQAKGKSGGLGLQNLGNGNYRFNWKTLKSYGNTCQSVKLNFNSGAGQELQAQFRFTRN